MLTLFSCHTIKLEYFICLKLNTKNSTGKINVCVFRPYQLVYVSIEFKMFTCKSHMLTYHHFAIDSNCTLMGLRITTTHTL